MKKIEVSTVKPDAFRSRFHVAACLFRSEDKLLFLKRHPKKNYGGHWCCPGGKLERGEQHLEAVKREVFEETALDIPHDKFTFLETFYIRYPEIDFVYHIFFHALDKQPEELKLSTTEHTDFNWIHLDNLTDHLLIPGEKACIEHLIPKLKGL